MRAVLHRLPFAFAITLVLVVKVALLYLLHQAFFAAPQVKKMRMPTAQIERHLLQTGPAVAPVPRPSLPSSKAMP